jgi:membrane protease subunit (stomatin/prohibitin family)
MTLREFISGELIDVIEWVDDTDDTMAWRFSRPNNEIKNGAQLIVRQSQVAILVDQGHIADVFMPGRHELSTSNLPVLSRLQGWKYGFESPFKADVIYLNTRQFIGQKWGTSNPVIVRDAELGPVRLRAFGTYAVRVTEPERFVEELVGTNATFHVDQTTEQLRDLVVAKVSVVLAGGSVSIYELSSKYGEIGTRVQEQVAPQFQQYGLQIAQLVIENVSLPPEVEATLDQKTRMNMLGDLDRYTRLQSADAIRDAARNPNGAAGAGMAIGVGAVVGQQVASASARSGSEPPPLPAVTWYYAVGNERRGPVDEAGLRSSGALTGATLVWKAGMASWAAASTIPELASLLPKG